MNVRISMVLFAVTVFGFSAPSRAFVECCPAAGQPDCNGNCEPDVCDLDCWNAAGFCGEGGELVYDLCYFRAATCGGSEDCNANGVPDECDPDVNSNGIPDDCEPPVHFAVSLDGQQANFCNGTGSPATGSGTLTLDWATLEVTYNIQISGLEGPEIQTHVHMGPNALPCAFGTPLYGLVPGDTKIGSFTLSSVDHALWMDAGLSYVLVHTDAHPNGEIRGQILKTIGGIHKK